MSNGLCDRCKCCSTDWESCEQCGGDGFLELYDHDPLYYDPDDTEDCQWCEGKGGWPLCLGNCDRDGKHSQEQRARWEEWLAKARERKAAIEDGGAVAALERALRGS